jgi:hypothetical protein
VALLKRGIPQTIASTDGGVTVSVPSDALAEDTYVTIIPEENAGPGILGRPYTIGPGVALGSPAVVSLRYDPSKVEAGKEGFLSVARSEGSGWVRLESSVDAGTRTVTARVSSLGTFAIVKGDAPVSDVLPQSYRLDQNYPNPFNPVTTIGYALREEGHALVQVYDVTGRRVATLVDRDQPAGNYRLAWDGKDGSGSAASSGVYFYRLTVVQKGAVTRVLTRKMLLAR